jgi:Na+/melibiose symporter-like transporter
MASQTLLVYYVEEQLNFQDQDIATMFLIFGILGVIVQGFIIRLINGCVGERIIVFISFVFGAIHNALYGVAHHKTTINIAIAFGSLSLMSFPAISAIKSNNVVRIDSRSSCSFLCQLVVHSLHCLLSKTVSYIVIWFVNSHTHVPFFSLLFNTYEDESEQGRIQGALYSIQALASALGPTLMRCVYHYTKNGAWMGPGSMFLIATCLYVVAMYCAYLLPVRQIYFFSFRMRFRCWL